MPARQRRKRDVDQTLQSGFTAHLPDTDTRYRTEYRSPQDIRRIMSSHKNPGESDDDTKQY